MNGISQDGNGFKGQQRCTSCDELNDPGTRFCINCGAPMVESTANDVVLSQNARLRETLMLGCCILPTVLLFVLIAVLMYNSEIPLENPIGFTIFMGFYVVFIIIFALVMILYILWLYKDGGKVRSFVIVGDVLRITTPRQPIFQISTKEFNAVNIEKRENHASLFKRVVYIFQFLVHGEVQATIELEQEREFTYPMVRKIMRELYRYCNRNDKEFSWWKRRKPRA
ncbi:hypothetical protein GF325_18920 [Candidatus Bathyarchaeota archaeon]|nr:hypothetical protein [Candidatus Bathyarchaeota archaeon]